MFVCFDFNETSQGIAPTGVIVFGDVGSGVHDADQQTTLGGLAKLSVKFSRW